MNNNKRCLIGILIALLIFNMTSSYAVTNEQIDETIYINNAQELMALADKCSLDTFSIGKTVQLTADIDLVNVDFISIPSFGGIFDGNGHTIKNIKLTNAGSNLGLFRYVEETGIVRNLNVTGTIKPEGTQKNIGGIVGSNKGRITNCRFTGTINAKDNIGGIAGINEPNGYISNCTVFGTITGHNYSGGIVGQNHGIIIQSTNESYVNTSDYDVSIKLDEINLSRLNASGNIISYTDTGGIAGYSNGILQSCINNGKIGYQHVGYNVGGIAGRQSGYISNCKNYGEIYGRKDVGGIAGQFEPYLLIKFSEDTLQQLEDELDTLEGILKSSIDNIDASSQDISSKISNLIRLTDQANGELDEVLTQTTDFADETITAANEVSFRISRILDRMDPIISNIADASNDITTAFDKFSYAFGELGKTSSELYDGIKDISQASKELSTANDRIQRAFDKISEATKLLNENLGNPEKVNEAVNLLKEGFSDLQKASENATEIINTLADLFKQLDDIGGIDWEKVSDDLKKNAEELNDNLSNAFPKIQDALTILAEVASDDIETIQKSMEILKDAFEYFRNAVRYIDNANIDLSHALIDFKQASQASENSMDYMEEGMSSLSQGSDKLSTALDDLEKLIADTNNKPNIEFPMLKNKVSEPTDQFFATLDDMSDSLDELNKSSSNSSSSIINDVRAINDQVWKIIDVIIENRKRVLEEDKDFYEDISSDDQDTINKKQISEINQSGKIREGYVIECYNEGNIDGDINISGIVGSIAIEYDFDPEDDIKRKGDSSLNFQYQTRSILRDSINKGKITAKKDYVGGAAGRMDLGLIYNCENYGSIESTSGDYVGGIAGSSSSTIKNSYSKCKLSGSNFVGGITGFGTNVAECYTLVKIDNAIESIGAISGEADGEFKNNFFVKNQYDGIDDISYSDKAVPQDYETFIQAENLPDEFRNFSVTFKADNKIISVIPLKYSDKISVEDLPKIPAKEGYYSEWPEVKNNDLIFYETIEAEYIPLITTVSVENADDQKHPKLLVEGTFGPDAVVTLEKDNSKPYKTKNNETITEQLRFSILEKGKELTGPFTIRYYMKTSSDDVSVYNLDNNKWNKIDAEIDGSYIVFKTNQTELTFSVVNIDNSMFLIIKVIIAVAVVAGLIILIRIRKKRKNKQLASN